VGNFIHRRQLTIEWAHCDPAGIVFNSRFFEIFDAGTWALLEAVLGVPMQELSAVFDITGVPLVDAGARFIAPVKFGDRLVHESQVRAFRRSSFDVEHRLSVGGELATQGRETRVWAALDQRGRLRSKPLPEEVTARFRTGAPRRPLPASGER
jgi:4-hydroxybenzoyl-CoA thioesterase